MRKKVQIEGDIEKYHQAQVKVHNELVGLKGRESAALAAAAEDILADRESAIGSQPLSDIHNREAVLNAAFAAAGEKLKALSLELDEYERDRRVQKWAEFKKSFRSELERIREIIGDFKVELIKVEGLVRTGEQSGYVHNMSQDFDIVFHKFDVLLSHLSGELAEDQAQVEQILSVLAKL